MTWSSLQNRWAVNLTLPTNQAGHSACVFLGCFDTDEEAVRVADKGRIRHVRLQMFEIHMQRCAVSDIYKMHSGKGAENIIQVGVSAVTFALLLQMCQSISCRVKDYIGASWRMMANCEHTH